jgi:hypothetical protein
MIGRHNHSITELDMTKINSGLGRSAASSQLLVYGNRESREGQRNWIYASESPWCWWTALNTLTFLKLARNYTFGILPIASRFARPRHAMFLAMSQPRIRPEKLWNGFKHAVKICIQRASYKGSQSRGLVFARKQTIEVPGQRGMLTLMDSTHRTNKAG